MSAPYRVVLVLALAALPFADGCGDGSAPGDAATTDAAAGYALPVSVGELEGVAEASGLVASRTYDGVLWTHNDSGNAAELFAISTTAQLVASYSIAAAENLDWEDIALEARDGADTILLGDIGDNTARDSDGEESGRDGSLRIYRVFEPDPASTGATGTLVATSFELVYPDRPYDCEAMFVDPRQGDLYLLTKVNDGGAPVFVARAPLADGATITLSAVATLDTAMITAADMSAEGSRVAFRTYGEIDVFPVTSDVASALTTTPWTPRFASSAEALAFAADGEALYTMAEGDPTHLYFIAWNE